jgi:hypothetical protein
MEDSFCDFNLVSWYKCNVYFCVQKGRKEFVTVSLTDVSIGQFTYEGSGWWSEGGQWTVVSSGGLKRKPHP